MKSIDRIWRSCLQLPPCRPSFCLCFLLLTKPTTPVSFCSSKLLLQELLKAYSKDLQSILKLSKRTKDLSIVLKTAARPPAANASFEVGHCRSKTVRIVRLPFSSFVYRSARSSIVRSVRLPIVVVHLPFVIDQDRSCPFLDAQIVQVPFKFSSFVRSFVFRSFLYRFRIF